AAVDLALLGRIQPGLLLARAGLAGLHLAAHLGTVPVGRTGRGVSAARGVARPTGRRNVRRVLPPGERRAARLIAPVLDRGRRPRLATRRVLTACLLVRMEVWAGQSRRKLPSLLLGSGRGGAHGTCGVDGATCPVKRDLLTS